MFLKAKKSLSYRTSSVATVTGTRRDGTPTARFEVAERGPDEIFLTDPETARALIGRGAAEKARLTGKLLALAEATLDVDNPPAAALATLPVKGVRVWHCQPGSDGHWRPDATSLGPTRGGFDAAFHSAEEIAAFWHEHPHATPLFSFLVEAGFRRAYRWHDGGLLEIATEIHRVGRG